MNYEKIGKFILEIRKTKNLTQKQLAEKIGVTDKAVSKWERGLGCPDVSLLGELSNALDVGIGELLNGERNENLKDNNEFIEKAVLFSNQCTQKNIYNKLSYLVLILISLLSIYLVFVNIVQLKFLNNKSEYYVNQATIAKMQEEYDLIQSKIDFLKNNNIDKLKIGNVDYQDILIMTSEEYLNNISRTNLLNFEGKLKLSTLELINFNGYLNNPIGASSFMLHLLKLLEYDNKNEYETISNYNYISASVLPLMNFDFYSEKYYDVELYYYHSINYEKYDINKMIFNLIYGMKIHGNLLDLIIEAGDVNE